MFIYIPNTHASTTVTERFLFSSTSTFCRPLNPNWCGSCVYCALDRCHLALWPSCRGSWCTPTRSQRCSVTTGSLSALPSRLRKLSPTGRNVSLLSVLSPKSHCHFIAITRQGASASSRGRCCIKSRPSKSDVTHSALV